MDWIFLDIRATDVTNLEVRTPNPMQISKYLRYSKHKKRNILPCIF